MPKRVSRSQFKKASLAARHARCKVQSEMFGMSKFVKVAKKKRNVHLDKEEDFHLVLKLLKGNHSILTCFSFFFFFFSEIIHLTYYRRVGGDKKPKKTTSFRLSGAKNSRTAVGIKPLLLFNAAALQQKSDIINSDKKPTLIRNTAERPLRLEMTSLTRSLFSKPSGHSETSAKGQAARRSPR